MSSSGGVNGIRSLDAITRTAWRLDLDGILHVFIVRSATQTRLLLNSHSQNELVEGAHPTVSETPNADNIVLNVCHGGSSTHPIISRVQSGIVNPHAAASNIYRDELKPRQAVGSENQAVSVTHP